jgi:hypothetical protein
MGDVSNWVEFCILLVSDKHDLLLVITSPCLRCVQHGDCWRQQLSRNRVRLLVLLYLVSDFFSFYSEIYLTD